MTAVFLTVPWPPTVNTYYRNVRGMMKISETGRAYSNQVSVNVRCAQIRGEISRNPLLGRLLVRIDLYQKDKRRRDIDNLFKALLDSITKAGVWGDDEQIDRLSINRHRTTGEAHATIYIERLPDTEEST